MSPDISTLPWDSPEFYPHAHAIAGKRLQFIEHKGKRILTIEQLKTKLGEASFKKLDSYVRDRHKSYPMITFVALTRSAWNAY